MRYMLLSLLVVLPAMVACASTAGTIPAEHANASEQAVEVNNTARHGVVVKYYTKRGGGPYYLGEVRASQTHTFVLPHSDVGHIFAETASGQPLEVPTTRLVHIRRVPARGTS